MKPSDPSSDSAALSAATLRQAQVAEIVRGKGQAKVNDLAALFGVSTQTIRKDINAMCERGLLRRVHGGVSLSVGSVGHYELRRALNLPQKQFIGQAVSELIPDGATLAVSIGTTPEVVVAALSEKRGIRIFSNNLHVAMAAHGFRDVEVHIPSGKLRRAQADIVGPGAVSFFDSYKFDIGLFGVAAVDEDGALLDLSEEDVHSREAISRNSKQRVLVLDSSKFGRAAHVRSGHITDVEIVVCDAPPPGPVLEMLKKSASVVVIRGEDAS